MIVVLVLAACETAGRASEPPERPAEYRGEITAVEPFQPITENCVDPSDRAADEPVTDDDLPVCTDPDTAPLGSALIEENPGVQEGDKIWVRIEQGTILRGGADGTSPISFGDLAVGDVVDAWVDGPVADSYPQQGGAEAIVVTG